MTSKPSSGSRSELLKMSVIIRLQGLPWSASALDIRQFFKGLTIPAGGVHIIGGDRGDAFIAFSSDEDARQAMMRNMAAISGTPVHLYLSSKNEMQSVIEEARSAEAATAAGGTAMMPQQSSGMQQGGMPQGGMMQGGMSQGGMQQGGMPHMGMQPGNMQQGAMQQGGMQQSGMPHGGMQQPGGMMQPGSMQQGGYQQGSMQQGGMQQQQPGGMQQPRGMQGDMQQGMAPGYPGQQGYGGAQGMNNQRFPQQNNFQMGRDMNQGQYPTGQNFMGQGSNQTQQSQMQGQQMPGQQTPGQQMPGQQTPGQQGRENQYGMQGDGTQASFQSGSQQNYPGGQQQSGQGGPIGQGGYQNQGSMTNQQGYPGNTNQGNSGNYGQQNQFGSGYGYGTEGNFGGNNYNQWQNMGQGQGQDANANQQFYGGSENMPQNRFPNQQGGQQSDQFGQNTGGQDRPFFPHQQQQQQQQYPGQMGDPMGKSDNFGYNQQGGFGQDGSNNPSRFPNQPERPDPTGTNRGGILPHPTMPGQDQAAGKPPDTQGQMLSRPGPSSRGTPDSHLRSPASGRSDSQPPVDQWPGMQKGQDQRKPSGSSEGQGPEGGEGFPKRDHFPPRGGMPQGDFSGVSQPATDQGDFPGGSRPGMQQGNFLDGSRPGMQQSNFPDGSRPGMPQGNFPDGSRPGMPPGDFSDGSRPSMQQGNFPAGPRPGMTQGNFPDGSRPGMPQGNFPDGSRPGMLQGNFPDGSRSGMQPADFPGSSRPGMQQGDFSGGSGPGVHHGDFPGGSRPGIQQGDFPGGSRPGLQQGNFPGGSGPGMQQGDFSGGFRPGMQQGDFPGGPRGRGGILPTPNVGAQGQQGGLSKEGFSDVEAMEHGQWPGYDEDGSLDKSEDPARNMRQDPDFRKQEAMGGSAPFAGEDSDFRDAEQRRGGFEGPGGGRTFDGSEDGRPMVRPRGRFDMGPDRTMERGLGGRPLLRDPDDRIQEMGPDGRPLLQDPMGRPFEGARGKSLERGPDGRPLERGPGDRPFDRGDDMKPDEIATEDTDVRFLDRHQDRGPDGRMMDRGHERQPFRGEGHQFGDYGSRHEGDQGSDRRSRFDVPGGRFDGTPDRSKFQGPPDDSRFSARGGRFDSLADRSRFAGPSDSRFSQHESYDAMDMDIDSQEFEEQGEQGSQERGFPGPRGMEDQNRGRGRGGMNRGRGRGFDQGFPPYGRPGDEGYPRYPMEGFGNQPFEDTEQGEMSRVPPEDFGDRHPGNRDFDSRRDFGRGRGEAEHGPSGRMDRRMDRGRGRFDMGRGGDMDSDRRPNQEDTDIRGRDRSWNSDDLRGTSKGLLGDAPVALLQDLSAVQEEDKDSRNIHQRDVDSPKERDRRSYSDRRDREDRDRRRDDRFGSRFDRRRSRDRSRDRSRERSPDRDRYSRRSDRDRDRSDRRDRDRDRDRDRSSHKDRESRSRDSATKDASSKDENSKEATSGKNEKDNGKTEQKSNEKKPTESADGAATEGKYIHVKGFPVTYNYREIRRFFFGCELPFDGIKIINDIQGQRTGESYLKFANDDTGKRAFRKNGETIFGNPVILAYTTSKVFESQIDSQTPASDSGDNKPSGPVPTVKKDQDKNNLIVMVQSLPFNVKREDLISFFSTVKIADNGEAAFVEYDSRNQATGVAYIETASIQDFKTALGHDGRLFGARPLKVTVGRREDMELCIKKQQEMFQRQSIRMAEASMPPQGAMGPGPMGPRPGLMGQLPGRPGLPGPMNMNHMNRPVIPPRNGPAFDPGLVLQQQQQQQPPPQQPPQQQPPPPSQQQKQQQGDNPGEQEPNHCVHIQGLPMLASYKDIREFFGDLNIVSSRGIQIVHDALGKPMGEGFVEFASLEDKEKALKRDKTSMGRHILAVKSVAKTDMLERLRNARFVGLPPGQGPPGQPNMPPRMPEPGPGGPGPTPNSNPTPMKPIPPGVLNRQWCYLSCQNFPPAVSIQEILSFFQKYSPIPESIRLHYAADGSPTGNAVVGFHKREEANRALQEMNNKRCRQCVVTLMPAM